MPTTQDYQDIMLIKECYDAFVNHNLLQIDYFLQKYDFDVALTHRLTKLKEKIENDTNLRRIEEKL